MKTQAYPYRQIAPGTFEIGEFDCASIFLLAGEEQAMLIDMRGRQSGAEVLAGA